MRELIDSQAGLRRDNTNLPDVQGPQWWEDYVASLKTVAERAGQLTGP